MNNNLTIKSYNGDQKESMPLAVFVYSDRLNEFPGDIIKDENVEKLYHRVVQDKQINGKTVEIINTDAEGRLVLADLLTYVQRTYKPKALIDMATLTGAVQRALGGGMSGAFTNNKELLQKLMVASEKANEPLWELPLAPKIYKGANKSYFADLKNSSDKPPGGTKAALFLYEFIENDLPWVHLDIAGTDTASGEPSSYYPRGATGVGTRTIVEFLRNMSEA